MTTGTTTRGDFNSQRDILGMTWSDSPLPMGSITDDRTLAAGAASVGGEVMLVGIAWDSGPILWQMKSDNWVQSTPPEDISTSTPSVVVASESTDDSWVVMLGGASSFGGKFENAGWYSCDSGATWGTFRVPIGPGDVPGSLQVDDAAIAGDAVFGAGYVQFGSELLTTAAIWRVDRPDCGEGEERG